MTEEIHVIVVDQETVYTDQDGMMVIALRVIVGQIGETETDMNLQGLGATIVDKVL